MTASQQMRRSGFRTNLRVRGRECITDTDETVFVLVDDTQPFPDPTDESKAMAVVFAHVHVEAGKLESPRDVGFFRETFIGGRNYKVLKYLESAADGVSQKFLCEAQRLNVVDE